MSDLPTALREQPKLSTWIQFRPEQVQVQSGKVELGQGISTALAMIAADELDVDIARITVQTGRTDSGPDEFLTAGSMSIEGSGSAIRQAAAEVRHHLLEQASRKFDVAQENLVVVDGVITNPEGNEQISYWELLDGGQVEVEATGVVSSKAPGEFSIVGGRTMRLDLPGKVTGAPVFIQDYEASDLHHGRVVRVRDALSQLVEVDAGVMTRLPESVSVIRDGNFLGVVSRSEVDAIQARQKLLHATSWTSDRPDLVHDTKEYLRCQPAVSLLVEEGIPTEASIPEKRKSDLEATYFKPFHLHGSIGPSAAVAVWRNQELRVFSHTQGPSIARLNIASVLGIDADSISVIHRENAGCYGHNGADDAAMDAALLAYHYPDVPILLKWEREDEHRHEPLSPAMLIDVSATVDDGQITYWSADVHSNTHMGRPMPSRTGSSSLLAALQKEEPFTLPEPRPSLMPHGGIHRNADPYYRFGERRITKNLITDTRIRTSSTRALGAFANVFAIESFMDELAHHTGIAPATFRINHLEDERAIEVIEALQAEMLSYEPAALDYERTGWGIAFARYKNRQTYAAVGIFLHLNEETFEVRLEHAIIAADAGQVIDRDGLINQLEGGLVQAASWTMKEQVLFDEAGSRCENWDSYPILNFSEVPTVETIILDRPELPSLGAGEATAGPTPAAIGNAIFDASGLRIRDIPFLPTTLREVALRG